MDVDKLLRMQKSLMDEVPHDVRPDVFSLMVKSARVIETLLTYLGSCGHKPWRPNPLDIEVRKDLMEQFLLEVERLEHLSELIPEERSVVVNPDMSRLVVSCLGVIEETIEYLVSVNTKSRKEQLEEITDILFFFLEMILLGKFTPTEIEMEYERKHAVNLERYKRGKEGDFRWDKRHKGGL